MKLKYIITLAMIFACNSCYSIVQKKMHAKGYYLSHSPYYTDGYLGARANRKHLYYGPSPYSYAISLSGTTHPTLHKREYRKTVEADYAADTIRKQSVDF